MVKYTWVESAATLEITAGIDFNGDGDADATLYAGGISSKPLARRSTMLTVPTSHFVQHALIDASS